MAHKSSANTAQDSYVQLDVPLATLERLLATQHIFASELHCPTPQAKAQLHQLLLKIIKSSQ